MTRHATLDVRIAAKVDPQAVREWARRRTEAQVVGRDLTANMAARMKAFAVNPEIHNEMLGKQGMRMKKREANASRFSF